jgi:protein O-mannosyl-transferase
MSQFKQNTRRAISNRPEETPITAPRIHIVAGVLLIVGSIFLIYWPAIHGGFVMDDDLLLTDNPLIKAPDGLSRIWLTRESVDYWPVSNSSLWLQWRLWGINPPGYHVINLLLHIADCLLIWLLLAGLAIPGAFLVALLFAVHPVNVESVAWISQHKNLLSLLFFLLSILSFLKSQGSLNRWYALSLIAFTLAMLSKGSVAILPLALLLIIWWQKERITIQNIYQTAPFFAVAIVFTLVNIWFQTHGSETAIRTATFAQRLAGAGAVPWFYLCKALIPVNLVFVYPQWNIQVSNPLWWLPLVALIAVTILLVRLSGSTKTTWARNLLFAWGFFCIALLPVLGFVDVGYMKYSLVADHYQYIALISVITLFAAAGYYRHSQAPPATKTAFKICAAFVVGVLAFLTWRQSQLYANSIRLYEATLQQNPSSWLIQTNLSIDLADADRIDEAISHAQEALRLNPNYPEAHNALGLALFKRNEPDAAMQQYQQALSFQPNFAEAYCNMGAVLAKQGQTAQAIENLRHAIDLKPDLFQAHWYLARALASTDQLPESLDHLQIAAQLHPGFVEAEMNMARILNTMGRSQDSLVHYENARRLKPNLPDVYSGLATVYAEMNRPNEAIAAAQIGLDLARSAGQVQLAEQLDVWLREYCKQQAATPVKNR